MLGRLFVDHPKSLGMSWAQHGAGAVVIGARMQRKAGAANPNAWPDYEI